MNSHHAIACHNLVADARKHLDAYCMVYGIFFGRSARAQRQRRPTYRISINGSNIGARSRQHIMAQPSLRKPIQILDLPDIATMRRNHTVEILIRGATPQTLIDFATYLGQVGPARALPGQPQHMRCDIHTVVVDALRSIALQRRYSLGNLQRMPTATPSG